ncbi:hypothetical protein TRIUR3_14471 [Triticum urartu]|uniref:Uncharacterized protein n=1 Tax=Triticum urartu TaxID=4572 RepID=M7ZZA4_TRIUA|nr:hypothetical protein TRIUR3_14471 [Triticum urartu]
MSKLALAAPLALGAGGLPQLRRPGVPPSPLARETGHGARERGMGRLDVGLRLQDVSSSFSSPPSPSTLALLRWARAEEVVDVAAGKMLDEMPLHLWESNTARGEATSGKF